MKQNGYPITRRMPVALIGAAAFATVQHYASAEHATINTLVRRT